MSDTLDDDLFGGDDDGDLDLFAQGGPDLFGALPDEWRSSRTSRSP